jgi:hypothetical protein
LVTDVYVRDAVAEAAHDIEGIRLRLGRLLPHAVLDKDVRFAMSRLESARDSMSRVLDAFEYLDHACANQEPVGE